MKKPQTSSFSRREPLYLQVEESLRATLSEMSPGDQLPAERVLADQFGVSLITIRGAIRLLTEEGLVIRMQGKGTFIADPPQKSKGWVAVTIDQDVSDPRTSSVYLKIAQEVRGFLENRGMASRLYIGRNIPAEAHTDFLCPEFFQDLESGEIRGVIGVLLYGKAAWLSLLKAQDIEMVGLGDDKNFGVAEDLRSFIEAAVRELKSRGKSNIALIAWQGHEIWRSQHSEIFREVMGEAGLAVNDQWVKSDLYPTLRGAGWSMFREIWSAKETRPDALIVADDFFMEGVSAAIEEIGISVPGQLEIAVRLAHQPKRLYPFPLISWCPNIPAISSALVDMQAKFMNGETPEPALVTVPIMRSPEFDQPPRETARNRGFTLIEILVVSVVISILALLLFPAVNSLKNSATSAGCQSNQKAIGAAILTYAADNQNYLPPAMVGPQAAWRGRIAPYADTDKIFVCTGHKAISPTNLNYGYNMAFGNVDAATGMRKGNYTNSTVGVYELHNLARFKMPSKTSMLVDLAHAPGTPNFSSSGSGHVFYYDGAINPASFAHNGAINVLWVDGHVSRVTTNEIKTWTQAQWNGYGNY